MKILDADRPPRLPVYIAVGCLAGAVIALQITIMRLFAVGSWAHFGSFVVSLAMMGFGLTSAVMCVWKGWFERHWQGVSTASLIAFGPLMVAAALIAQRVPFNAIFIVSDPSQKWRLFANFVLYFLPFLAGAVFLGTVFLRAARSFGRVYFADLAGSGLAGLVVLVSMFVFPPQDLIAVPLALWAAGALLWFVASRNGRAVAAAGIAAILSVGAHQILPGAVGTPKLAVSDYKGVAYAQKFPDSRLVYANASPFGYLQVYASSYLHFAPGLSDNAAFNLPTMPSNAFLGLYIDGDGPSGIIRDLPASETAYFHYLPMNYPYELKKDPKTFVVQFGGGISTAVALKSGSKSVTVAEGNPAVLNAFRTDPELRSFTGDILSNQKLTVIPYDGRLYLAYTNNRYDVIDLSLADSAGLSSPGGFAITEKFSYTQEAMLSYMRALSEDGILSVTLWNKEEPPKSVLKLYATMAAAAREFDPATMAKSFFAVSTYLSTTTVLYKRGGFTSDEIGKLRSYTRSMSFDEIYYPGFAYDTSKTDKTLDGFRSAIFGAANEDPTVGGNDPTGPGEPPFNDTLVPATTLGQLVWHSLVHGGSAEVADRYVFDMRPLTNNRPYFAAYVKTADLPLVTDRLDILQDEWGYLLIWATLGIAGLAALSLVLFPVVVNWRTIFSAYPGKGLTILYFACLGLGYIMVEVGMISEFTLALSNPTVSASILISGMLVASGLGSFASERFLHRAREVMPMIFAAIGALLILYGLFLDNVLDLIGTLPYVVRLALCFALIFPPAFLMGFPMPTAMATLARLGKEHMFLWAWGINGCFSVVGAALVPILATSFGLAAVLEISGAAYLLAIPAFFAVLLPLRRTALQGAM
ncbi:MAG: hypothetical protein U1E56_11840 [Bauldia sp.]